MIDFTNYKTLMASLKDEAVCRKHTEEMCWGGNITCPFCGVDKGITWFGLT